MYIAEIVNQWRRRRQHDGSAYVLPPTVYALGATSLLTDISTEMVASILPVYLLLALKLSPSEYGLIDGLFRGGAAVIALLLGGLLTGSSGRSKLIAGLGYTFSAATRLLLLFGTSFSLVATSLVLDRLGKGVRVAPRDAMLAASVPTGQLGRAFGVHRAMDAVGAMLGPLLAALILWWRPAGFTWVFAASFLASLIGLWAFWRYVREPVVLRAHSHGAGWRMRWHFGASLPPACRPLLMLAMLLALFTVGEGMIFAHLQRSFALEPFIQPLLPVATAAVFLLLAAPMGRLADRCGAVRVFCGAHLLLLPLYAMLAMSEPALPAILAVLALQGGFFAATDGVLMAAVSAVVLPQGRGMSLAIFAAGIASAKLISSSLFGLLWDKVDIHWALLIYAAGMALALLLFVWRNPLQLLDATRHHQPPHPE